jgi:hypothetical protein
MKNKPHQSYPLSYDLALKLFVQRQSQKEVEKERLGKREVRDPKVKECHRLYGRALAKAWAAKVYGNNPNKAPDQEDVESPLSDNTRVRPTATDRDVRFHCHKAIRDIGFVSQLKSFSEDHPIVSREYLLLSIRFRSSSLPSKLEFSQYILIYLKYIKEATQAVDKLIDSIRTADRVK